MALTICTSSSLDVAKEKTKEKIPRGISRARVMEWKIKTKMSVMNAPSSPIMNDLMMKYSLVCHVETNRAFTTALFPMSRSCFVGACSACSRSILALWVFVKCRIFIISSDSVSSLDFVFSSSDMIFWAILSTS